MQNLTTIIVCLLCCISICGCQEKAAETTNDKILKNVKITDLIGNKTTPQSDRTEVNFQVYLFHLLQENYAKVSPYLDELVTELLKYRDSTAFSSNGFGAGLGSKHSLEKLTRTLEQAGARCIYSRQIKVLTGIYEEIALNNIPEQRSILYYSGSGKALALTFGPGRGVLNIVPQKAIGLRGVCDVYITPVFRAIKNKTADNNFAERNIANIALPDRAFDSSAIVARLSPDEFIALWPKDYAWDNTPICAGVFLTGKKPKPYVRICVIMCTGIID